MCAGGTLDEQGPEQSDDPGGCEAGEGDFGPRACEECGWAGAGEVVDGGVEFAELADAVPDGDGEHAAGGPETEGGVAEYAEVLDGFEVGKWTVVVLDDFGPQEADGGGRVAELDAVAVDADEPLGGLVGAPGLE